MNELRSAKTAVPALSDGIYHVQHLAGQVVDLNVSAYTLGEFD
jgi:hypothetical protein